MEPTDMAMLHEMINDPEIENATGGWGFPVSQWQQQKWYESAVNDTKTRRFMIETTDTEVPQTIGMIYLTDLDWKNRSVATGIKLSGNAPRGKGYATDAVMALLGYAFQELQMHRVSLKIKEDNFPSVKLYERCGGKREGILRETLYKDGRFWNQYAYGILKADYEEAYQKYYG
jgi:RimJ/RimL family protein N-acetyltransferase